MKKNLNQASQQTAGVKVKIIVVTTCSGELRVSQTSDDRDDEPGNRHRYLVESPGFSRTTLSTTQLHNLIDALKEISRP